MQAIRLQLKLCTLPLSYVAPDTVVPIEESFSVFDVLNFHIYAVTDLASMTGTGG
jgi:hypothetical protein